MNYASPISRLARVAEALAADQLPEPADRMWLVQGARTYIGGEWGLLEALGLNVDQGQRDPRTALALERRDVTVRAASKYWPVAENLHLALNRYFCSGWQRERHLQECPANRIGRPEEWLWRILNAREQVICSKHIRDIVRK